MDFSNHQCAVLELAQELLEGAGLSLADLEAISSSSRPSSRQSSRSSTPSVSPPFGPSPAVIASRYLPPPACPFNSDKINRRFHKINSKLTVDRIVIHELNVIVEYPQTGDAPDRAVAHVFPVDPDHFMHPKFSFQYSLGGSHGGLGNITCSLLRDGNGGLVSWFRATGS